MALEIELKYRDVDHEAVRERLEACGADRVGIWFESNAVFDDSFRRLKGAGILLRLRRKGDASVLTVKVPPDQPVPEGVKVFEERECVVADFEAMSSCLSALGYHVVFAYEKVREKWKLEGCAVCLDRLPFGMYVEIEGQETAILNCANRLGLSPEKASTETYYSLNIVHRAENGLPEDESFVFGDAERARLLKELQTC